MNTKDTLSFLGSLSSKICHDIVAPVSAIDMGLSLLEDQIPESLKFDPAYDLLKDSLEKTLSRINFFRYALAFGKNDAIPAKTEFTKYCEGACKHFKIKFVLENFDIPPTQQTFFLRIVTCILYLLIDTLPKGGTITLSISNKLTSFDVVGPMVIKNPALDKIINNVRENYRAQTILPELVLIGLNELGIGLNVQNTPNSLKAILS